MEKYRVHHYKKVHPRNRNERVMIYFIKKTLEQPTYMKIGELRDFFIDVAKGHELQGMGKVTFSEICVGSTIAGQNNICTRQFGLLGAGRKTTTLSIYESVFKDSNKEYAIAKDCIFNKNEE